jgi:hypothetical protein
MASAFQHIYAEGYPNPTDRKLTQKEKHPAFCIQKFWLNAKMPGNYQKTPKLKAS